MNNSIQLRRLFTARTLFDNRGFTLVEMIVVCAIFVMVIMITGSSFNTIITQVVKLRASEESNIEGIVGLEMMRHDIEQAGFGLPWVSMDDDNPLVLPDYDEAASPPHSNYNDGGTAGACRIPRAIVSGDNLASSVTNSRMILPNTDYLAVKATSVGRTTASQRWTYVTYFGAKEPVPIPPVTMLSDNIPNGAGVIVTRRQMVEINGTNRFAAKLIYDDDPSKTSVKGYFYQPFPAPGNALPLAWSPQMKEQVNFIYGVDDGALRMPFNRVNFFVARPQDTTQIPSVCAPNTGILYKTTVNHGNGQLTYIPLMDCVADIQVVLGFDMDGSGQVLAFSDANGTNVSGFPLKVGEDSLITAVQNTLADASLLRERLKVVKIYILAQEGRLDTSINSKTPIVVGNALLGETTLTKSYDLAANNALNYRWKVYKIIAKPKNFLNN